MCGIAGILLKDQKAQRPVGDLLLTMLSALDHRGPDSTGVAVYGPRRALTMRLAVEDGVSLGRVESLLRELGRVPEKVEPHPRYSLVELVLESEADAHKVIDTLADLPGVDLHSYGRHIDLIKDTVRPGALAKEFGIDQLRGSHGIGHVRLATESRVACGFAHPFQSLDLPDLATVHNGQITNYHTNRRILERKGLKFQTDNDSELIAQYLAYFILHEGCGFAQALDEVRSRLDGTFSFIVATGEGIGAAKDRLAAKPMIVGEVDWAVAVASEEIAIHNIFGDGAVVEELPPYEVRIWNLQTNWPLPLLTTSSTGETSAPLR